MEWLSGWLKQLIAIILLAAFVDLLLPTHAMQRYVKTVIGMFLLLVMLSPVFHLFERKWNAEQMLAAVSSSQLGASADGGMESLPDIMRQADKLQAADRQQAQQMVQTELAAAIKGGIEQSLNRKVDRVEVQTSVDDKGSLAVRSVSVILLNIDSRAETPPETGLVRPVKPVTVNVQPVAAIGERSAAVDGNPSDQLEQDDVKNYLSREWQIRPEQITVTTRKS